MAWCIPAWTAGWRSVRCCSAWDAGRPGWVFAGVALFQALAVATAVGVGGSTRARQDGIKGQAAQERPRV